ncbi:MAG: prepilin-type N-terminal cleavage/methylation domain-containing protein [Comamonadaceae bacterium]|nr:MAG: prepilin-type N-terminal cleavage/methylation domain-containing protein [Comamonadaceae bacterium]
MTPTASARRIRGFTLIELLVALAAMSLLALMSWRGLEAMATSQGSHRARDDAVLVLQTALSQWQADLDAATAYGSTPALEWDGRALRLTRRSAAGSGAPAAVHVVAWALRVDGAGQRWWRWQSPPIATRSDWQQAWNLAASWSQGGGGTLDGAATPLLPVAAWSIGYFRDGNWSAATPSPAPAATAGQSQPLPDGLRLVLQLPPGDGLGGTITRDWARPTFAVARGG